TSVLLAASVLGMVLAFAEKSPCRSGAWNSYASQFQRACYTDIYPLYYNEGLSAGKVPYTGHPVEYPVLIGGAMPAAARLGRRGCWAGFLLGLGVATQFYPLVVFGPLLLLCLRAGRMRDFTRPLTAAVIAWLAVNLPVMFAAPSGWARFYVFSKDRGADWGSI